MTHPIESFEYKGTPIQILGTPTDPLFVAREVCEALGLKDTESALRKLDTDEKLNRKLYASGQRREVTVINEPGLYSLVLRSTKPEAKAFKRWLTHEVLPSIRKTGRYGGNNKQLEESLAEVSRRNLAAHLHASSIWNLDKLKRLVELKPLLTVQELANLFGCSKSTVKKVYLLWRRANGDFEDRRPKALRGNSQPIQKLEQKLSKLIERFPVKTEVR